MTLFRLAAPHGIACLSIIAGLCGAARIAYSNEALETKSEMIHQRVLTVDTHVDTPLRMLGGTFDIGERHDLQQRGGRVDLPRMKEGGLDAVFFAVYMGQGPRTPAGHKKAKDRALQIFEAIHSALEQNGDQAELAVIPGDAYRLKDEGKRAIFIGMENGYPVGRDLSLVKDFYDQGARYITLCHSRNNDICDSSTDDEPEFHGMSEFGEQVVREMNRLGMMVDVSHASDETFYDVIKTSAAPIIASHSCARAICDHPRNLDDAMLRALAAHEGVIQICILGSYIKKSEPNPEREKAMKQLRSGYDDYESLPEDRKREVYARWEAINRDYPGSSANVSHVVDHIDHVVKVAGIEHVGIGTDFDGGGGLEGCQDVSEMGNITLELVRRGYSEHQIRKIWGGNVMRVFREVERVAEH